jgi:hypothetical protein
MGEGHEDDSGPGDASETTGTAGTTPSGSASTPPESASEPTGPRDVALLRQQLFVGSGVAALGGIAVVVGGTQQFPGVPFVATLGAGAVTTGLLFGLLFASLFRGGTE